MINILMYLYIVAIGYPIIYQIIKAEGKSIKA